MGVVKELIREIIKGHYTLQVRFLLAYEGHLYKDNSSLSRDEFLQFHTKVMAGKMVEEINRLKPDYPLGYYREMFKNG